MDVVAERRFQSNSYSALKRRLDALNYTQPFAVNSAALVERLLNDLIKTTEGFQQLKRQGDEARTNMQDIQGAVGPLQREHTRLVQENNELHLELMRTKEDCDARDNKWRASVKKLEGEVHDFKFLLERSKQDYARLEREDNELRTRLDTLMAKTYLPSSAKGLHDRALKIQEANISARGQTFEVSRPLRPSEDMPEPFRRDNAEWASELRQADDRSRRLQDELETLRRERLDILDELDSFKELVGTRDQEIDRLSKTLGEGLDLDLLRQRYREQDASKSLELLNERLDFVNGENIQLVESLASAQAKLSKVSSLFEENEGLSYTVAELKQRNKLLRAKVADLERLSQDLQPIDFTLTEDLQQARLKVEELQSSVKTLSLELKRAKEEGSRTGQLQAAYQSDRKAFSDAMERLEVERASAAQQLLEEVALKERLEQDLRQTREELKLSQTQLSNLRKQVELTQQSMSRINKDNISTAEESYSLRQQISTLEGSKALLESELTNARCDLERLSKLKSAAELHGDSLKHEFIRLKTELDSVTANKQRLQVLQEGAANEAETHREETRALTRLRETDRRTILDFERKVKELQTQLQATQDNVRGVQREHLTISEELADKLEELRKGESLRLGLEKELAELRPLRVKWQESLNELRRNQENAQEKDLDYVRRRKETEELRDLLRSRSAEVEDLHSQLAYLREERDRLKLSVEELDNRRSAEAAYSRRLEYAEDEVILIKQQLEASRESERRAVKDLEHARAELAKQEDRLLNANKQLDREGQQRHGLQEEIARLKNEVTSYYSKDSAATSSAVKLEERVFQASLQTEELRRQLGQEQTDKYRLEDELSSLKRTVESERTANKRTMDQLNQLKTLVESLEKGREDLSKKLQAAHSDIASVEDRRASNLGELAQLREELGRKDDEIRALQEAVRTGDKERDYVQSVLDNRTSQLAGLQGTLSAQGRDLAELREALASSRTKDEADNKRVEDRTLELRRLTEHIKELEKQIEDSHRNISYGQQEILGLQGSLHVVTKENQHVNEQLNKLSQERDRLRQLNEELSRSERSAQQAVRTVNREKEDLTLTYRKTMEEHGRLSQSFSSVQGEQKDAQAKRHSLEQELSSAQRQLQRTEEQLNSSQIEASTLQRQLSSLTLQVEGAERRTQDAYRARDEALREVNSARQTTMGIETNKEETQRQLAKLEDDRLGLEGKLRSAQNEALTLREQLSLKRRELADLEEVLTREREVIGRLQSELTLRDEEVMALQRKSTYSSSLEARQALYSDPRPKYQETSPSKTGARFNREEFASRGQLEDLGRTRAMGEERYKY
jgi:centrosomal protein CEP135